MASWGTNTNPISAIDRCSPCVPVTDRKREKKPKAERRLTHALSRTQTHAGSLLSKARRKNSFALLSTCHGFGCESLPDRRRKCAIQVCQIVCVFGWFLNEKVRRSRELLCFFHLTNDSLLSWYRFWIMKDACLFFLFLSCVVLTTSKLIWCCSKSLIKSNLL